MADDRKINGREDMKIMTSRKKYLIVSATLAAAALTVGLLCWCFSGPRTEVVFIPGWQTADDRPELYEERLKSIYPMAKIKTLFWKSNASWDVAKTNANDFAPEVYRYIVKKAQKDRAEIIVVAHSLGGRIAIETAKYLAKRKVRIKQFILLGAAVNCDTNVNALSAASTGTNLNVFCLKDDTLGTLYSNAEKKLAAGFCGLDRPPAERFEQYALASQTAGGVKLINHTANTYFGELKRIVAGETEPYYPKYDYSRVDLVKVPLGVLPVPSRLFIPEGLADDMEILDEYAGWKLAKIRAHATLFGKKRTCPVYIIIHHHGFIRLYSVIHSPIKKLFDEIKGQIKDLPPRPDKAQQAAAANLKGMNLAEGATGKAGNEQIQRHRK